MDAHWQRVSKVLLHQFVSFSQVNRRPTAMSLQSRVSWWERKIPYTALEVAAMVVVKDGYKIGSAVTQKLIAMFY